MENNHSFITILKNRIPTSTATSTPTSSQTSTQTTSPTSTLTTSQTTSPTSSQTTSHTTSQTTSQTTSHTTSQTTSHTTSLTTTYTTSPTTTTILNTVEQGSLEYYYVIIIIALIVVIALFGFFYYRSHRNNRPIVPSNVHENTSFSNPIYEPNSELNGNENEVNSLNSFKELDYQDIPHNHESNEYYDTHPSYSDENYIDIANEDLQQNADADGNIKAFDAIPYQVDFE